MRGIGFIKALKEMQLTVTIQTILTFPPCFGTRMASSKDIAAAKLLREHRQTLSEGKRWGSGGRTAVASLTPKKPINGSLLLGGDFRLNLLETSFKFQPISRTKSRIYLHVRDHLPLQYLMGIVSTKFMQISCNCISHLADLRRGMLWARHMDNSQVLLSIARDSCLACWFYFPWQVSWWTPTLHLFS